jgi:hypothetical protein
MTLVHFAYIDPGSGSMLLQVIVGGIAAVAVGAKMFGRRLWRVFIPRGRTDDEPEGRQEP